LNAKGARPAKTIAFRTVDVSCAIKIALGLAVSDQPHAIPAAAVVKDGLSPIDNEAEWLATTYQPNEPNLTLRAAIAGALIGMVMCLSNIYVFFKTGWSLGVTLTACIIGLASFKGLQRIGATKRPLGMLENNALTTVASGAGFMTGGGNMAAYGALLMMITAAPTIGVMPSTLGMIVWFAVIAAMGVFAAIPIKRQLINQEALAFPTGTATAETLRSIHSTDGKNDAAKWLGMASAVGGLISVLRDALHVLPHEISLPVSIAGYSLLKWTLYLKTEVVLLGAGALMSFRTGWSMLFSGVLTYAVLAPELMDHGLIKGVSYKEIVAWTLWPGAAMLVGAGLTSFALDYKSLGRALSGLTRLGRKNTVTDGITAVEVPETWFPLGFMVLSPIVVFLMAVLFNIPVWAAIIAVPLSVIMGFIASRVTGETDVTPTKALGPVTQMMFGVMTPGNLTGNIMSANVTGGIGLHAADLLTTLKTGWLLGAKPRHQLYAQLIGVAVGAAFVAPAFALVIPNPALLGSELWPAPSCTVWKGVSVAFSNGISALHPSVIKAIWIGLALGITLTLVEKFAPKHIRKFVPSANGVGIAMVIPGANSIAMFLGAAVAEVLRRYKRDAAVVPVASGLIAGESIIGIVILMMSLAGWL
jgi:putative OPT family oligopeptide transporter